MTPKIRSQLRTAANVAESGKIPAAIQLYRELLADDPELAPAWVGLANILKDEGERREAYEKALEIEPKNSEALEKLAVLNGKELPEISILKDAEKDKGEAALTETEGEADSETAEPVVSEAAVRKVEPNVGGIFSHPVDISEWVQPDGSMVDYKTGAPTNLRCNRCGRPISLKSSKSTSVGYRCFTCIYEIEESYYEATSSDFIIAMLLTGVISLITGFLVTLVGGFGGIFIFFIAFAVGGGIGAAIARVIQQAIGRRRGRNLPNILAVIMAISIFLPALIFGSYLISAIVAFAAASGARVQLR